MTFVLMAITVILVAGHLEFLEFVKSVDVMVTSIQMLLVTVTRPLVNVCGVSSTPMDRDVKSVYLDSMVMPLSCPKEIVNLAHVTTKELMHQQSRQATLTTRHFLVNKSGDSVTANPMLWEGTVTDVLKDFTI